VAAPKIKKKATANQTTAVPRQGAIPCLILVILILAVVAFFFFAGFHVG
jgi:hypothetical protein